MANVNQNLTPIRTLLRGDGNILIIPSGNYEIGKEYTASAALNNMLFYFAMYDWVQCDITNSHWYNETWNSINLNLVQKIFDNSIKISTMVLLYKQSEPYIFKINHIIRCVLDNGNLPNVSSQTTGDVQLMLSGMPNLYRVL